MLGLVFDVKVLLDAKERGLADLTMELWSSFAADGRPSSSMKDVPAWPVFASNTNGTTNFTFVLDLAPAITSEPISAALCDFWFAHTNGHTALLTTA